MRTAYTALKDTRTQNIQEENDMDLYVSEVKAAEFFPFRVRDRDNDGTLLALFRTKEEAEDYMKQRTKKEEMKDG